MKNIFWMLKQISKQRLLIKEKKYFAQNFIAKIFFISCIKNFYVDAKKNQKKCLVAVTLHNYHLTRNIFQKLDSHRSFAIKKRNAILQYAFMVFFFLI